MGKRKPNPRVANGSARRALRQWWRRQGLPCQICGGEAFMRRLYMTYIVDAKHDDNCPLSCRVLPYDARWCTRMAAQAAWNRRAMTATDELRRLQELVEDMLDCIEIRAAFGRPPTDEMYETFAQRAYELGVEVDG